MAAAVMAAIGGGKKAAEKASTKKVGAPVAAGPKARSVQEILAERRARLAKAQEVYEPGADVLEAVLSLLAEEAEVVNAHTVKCARRDQLRKDKASPTAIAVENDAIVELEGAKAQYRVDLDAIRKAEGGGDRVVEAALQRMDLRRKAGEVSQSLAALDAKGTKAEEFAAILAGAVVKGTIKSGVGPIEWAGQKYGSAITGDPVLDQLEQAFVDFIAARKAAVDERRFADDALAAPRMMSEEEAGHLKIHPETARSLKGFLGGEGLRYFLPVFDNGRHIGNAVLERENARVSCKRVAAKYSPLALKVFYPYDRETDQRKARGDVQADVRVFKKGDEVTFDLDRVKNNLIRGALQAQLDKERASEAKREHAAELRDVAGIDNPITFADLRAGTKGIWPVSITKWRYTVGNREMESPVTFQVVGTGDKHFTVGQMVEGTDQKIAWIPEFTKPAELRRLDERGWRAIAGLNSWFERDWQLAKEAAKRNAQPLSHENAAGLFDLDGADGMYAVRARWYRKPDQGDSDRRGRFSPVGYLVERSGSTLKVVWALPGLSARLAASENEEAPAFFEREFEIADLHPLFRAVLRSAYMAIRGLKGREGYEQVPTHLRPATEEAEEEGNGGNGHDE